ncbi:2,3-dihydro-2,3-dihydroxybenzoate dehydrogenase [Streptomyces sp. SID8352]|uniref:2,3-dihydro-2,3-dihydroxybenzoate dehydrogenase n=1 Tax=unclassified Streptomyces TaxID=2593676 RepID=UPI00136F315A|nr:2,3-dihydro-2,3-dihydroxybenzoate dehydrogenase [Streptomyces sp. SID8352]MYU23735.1 2,3-dihydro-2,3-dihydroxybenzoate dehydrogenase [Streptomyces sp. SID8352]
MENRVALVTGAAGGIGGTVARVLAERGAVVAAVDHDPERLAESVEKLRADGLDVHAHPVDVTDGAAVERLAGTVEDTLGPVDHLVNAAGVLHLGEVCDYRDEDWRATFGVNVDGVFHVSRAVVRRMVARGGGSMVTVSSNAAATPRASMAAYAASKAAATMFTKSLGLEVARHGVRCNVVAPGSTDTPMLRSMWRDESGRAGTIEGDLGSFRAGIPLGRVASTANVADAVAFLLSDQASHITLHVLTVDGGASLGS